MKKSITNKEIFTTNDIAMATCSRGTVTLNAIKRFFGFEPDRSCWERD